MVYWCVTSHWKLIQTLSHVTFLFVTSHGQLTQTLKCNVFICDVSWAADLDSLRYNVFTLQVVCWCTTSHARFSQSMLGVRQCRGTMGRLDTHKMLSVSSTTDQMLIILEKRYVLPPIANYTGREVCVAIYCKYIHVGFEVWYIPSLTSENLNRKL